MPRTLRTSSLIIRARLRSGTGSLRRTKVRVSTICFLVLSTSLFFGSCSSGDSTGGTIDVTDAIDIEPGVCPFTSCTSLSDCDDPGPCASKVSCENGCCVSDFVAEGTACDTGCLVGGTCNGAGECVDAALKDCGETDGNLCTLPKCDENIGKCIEAPLPDGSEPSAASDCWVGAICVGGKLDKTGAKATEKALECQQMTDDNDAFGCVDHYECVGGQEGCFTVLKNEGQACWTDALSNGETCVGRSCNGVGECVVDTALNEVCTDEDFADECDEGCRECTELSCHWIPDPANPTSPNKKVRYCKHDVPPALMGSNCEDGDLCTEGDACALGSQTNGPMGKETLGTCMAGADRECPSYLCATGSCNSESGDCVTSEPDHDYCTGFSLCLENTGDVKCDPKHTDADEETGCVFIWKSEGASCEINDACVKTAECTEKENKPGQYFCKPTDEKTCPDDGNPCTEDKCVDVEGKATCDHVSDDTLVCEDNNLCTINLCVDGVCTTTAESTCPDPDGNPCNGPICVPETGECIQNQKQGEGDACGWIGDCVAKECNANGDCLEVPLVSDGTPDLPNGLDDDCDGKVDENGYLLWGVAGSSFVTGSDLSGDANYTVKSVLGDSHAAPEFDITATDGKYKLFSGLPTVSQE